MLGYVKALAFLRESALVRLAARDRDSKPCGINRLEVVAPSGASWNQIVPWLRQLTALQQSQRH
jgi:hypothetical protein